MKAGLRSLIMLLAAGGVRGGGTASAAEGPVLLQEAQAPSSQDPAGGHGGHPAPPPASSQDRPAVPDGRFRMHENLDPERDFPEPVNDDESYGSFLSDVLEYRPGRGGGDVRWDIEGWYGKDYDRLWYKSEGERDTALKAEYDLDFQLLYGRMIHPYFDLQIGARVETQSFRDSNVTRPLAVVGLEGLLPYFIELESAVFVDSRGNVSARASLTRDFLFTNRLVLQGRFETNAAIQEVERFTTGRWINNVEAGLRLRYEFSRQFAPYVGVSFDQSFSQTATFVRGEGGDPSQIRFVVGLRLLF